MRNIFSDLPSPEDVLKIELEELADHLLNYLKSLSDNERSQLRRETVVSRPYHELDIPPAYRALPREGWERVSEALREAWGLLEHHRLVNTKPEGFFFITRLGHQKDALKLQVKDVSDMHGIHPDIKNKCYEIYKNKTYAEAVEKSFKVARDRLRDLTGYETGSDAFGKGKLYIEGASASNVDKDFNQAVKFPHNGN